MIRVVSVCTMAYKATATTISQTTLRTAPVRIRQMSDIGILCVRKNVVFIKSLCADDEVFFSILELPSTRRKCSHPTGTVHCHWLRTIRIFQRQKKSW